MRILIDTHVLLWADQRPSAIAPKLMAVLQDPRAEVFVSAASVWEIAIKRAIGKLQFIAPIGEVVTRLGFEFLPINGAHAELAGGLPRHHTDPFDRMLIAQAIAEGMALGTQDPMARSYRVTTLGLD